MYLPQEVTPAVMGERNGSVAPGRVVTMPQYHAVHRVDCVCHCIRHGSLPRVAHCLGEVCF
jgi:hypothetical protein